MCEERRVKAIITIRQTRKIQQAIMKWKRSGKRQELQHQGSQKRSAHTATGKIRMKDTNRADNDEKNVTSEGRGWQGYCTRRSAVADCSCVCMHDASPERQNIRQRSGRCMYRRRILHHEPAKERSAEWGAERTCGFTDPFRQTFLPGISKF